MSSVETPHFNLPFDLSAKGADVVEQDSVDDVGNCVFSILATHIGTRDFLPGFGVQDFTFRKQPLNIEAILAIVGAQEPRAVMTGEEARNKYDPLIDVLNVRVETTARKEG